MTSFDSYDFVNDERWKTIEANVYIPPGPDHDALLLRRKRRFYRDTIDPEYKWTEPPLPSQQQSGQTNPSSGGSDSSSSSSSASSSSASSSSTASSSSSSTSTPPPFQGYRHHVPPSSSSSSSTSSAAARNNFQVAGLSLPILLSYAQLLIHCIILLLFPFVFLPLLSIQAAHTAYTYSLYLSALAYTLNLVRTHSIPTSPYQQYFLRLLQDHHSHFLFYTFVCLSAPPNAIFLVPFTVRSTLYVAGALSRLLPNYLPAALSERVVPLLNKVVGQAAELQRTNAILEITAGVYTIVMLFTSSRSFFLVFLYFQYLRMRYLMSPDSQYAWAVVRTTVEKYMHAAWMPPVVRAGYEKVRGWMESMVDTQRMAGAGGGGGGGMLSRCTIM